MAKKQTKNIEWLSQNYNKFCALPWINLNTNPDGKLKLCCNIQNNNSILTQQDTVTPFNLGYHSIDEIWNSEYMTTIRGEQISNQGSKACKECYLTESITGSSPRTGQNDEWIRRKNNNKDVQTLFDNSLNKTSLTHMPISLELRLGNQCNLQCSSCWGMSSSLTHDERSNYLDQGLLDSAELVWLKTDWEVNRKLVEDTDLKNWFETDIFYENFRKIAPTLKRLYTTGGEPTLIKANYRMFQMLLDAGNTACNVEFTTNMTTFNPEFYDRLAQFENVEIQMSIDGIDEIGEYIRYPTDFTKVRETVQRVMAMASTRPGWRVKCYTVLQALNFKDVENIWKYLDQLSKEYHKSILWWPITLSAPTHLSLAAVPEQERINHIENIKSLWQNNYYSEFNLGLFQINYETWNAYYNTIMNMSYDDEQHTHLVEYIKFIDKNRHQDGELLFGDLL